MTPIPDETISNAVLYHEILRLRDRMEKLENKFYMGIGGLGILFVFADIGSRIIFS